jgi:hypothetical protein
MSNLRLEQAILDCQDMCEKDLPIWREEAIRTVLAALAEARAEIERSHKAILALTGREAKLREWINSDLNQWVQRGDILYVLGDTGEPCKWPALAASPEPAAPEEK